MEIQQVHPSLHHDRGLRHHIASLESSIALLRAVPVGVNTSTAIDIAPLSPHSSLFRFGLVESETPGPSSSTTFVADGCSCECIQVVCSLRFSPPLLKQGLGSRGWAEKLLLMRGVPPQFSLQSSTGAATSCHSTSYDPTAHPARSLLMGPKLTALVYPTGVVVTTGTDRSELAVAKAAREAVEVAMQVQ